MSFIWDLLANAYSTEHVYYNNVLFRFPKIKSKNVLCNKVYLHFLKNRYILELDYLSSISLEEKVKYRIYANSYSYLNSFRIL